jgi:hypothetical protein
LSHVRHLLHLELFPVSRSRYSYPTIDPVSPHRASDPFWAWTFGWSLTWSFVHMHGSLERQGGSLCDCSFSTPTTMPPP